MPYILQEQRTKYLEVLGELPIPHCAGDLNFIISTICHRFVIQNTLRYETLNLVIGTLECAKQEFYRAIAAPYENQKWADNGGISELDSQPLLTVVKSQHE